MSKINRAHAVLSASGAERWMACPRSVALEELVMGVEEGNESPYAQEGTLAHEVAETRLKGAVGIITSVEANKRLLEIAPSQEMLDYTGMYVEECLETFETAKMENPDTVAFVEMKVKFTEWVPEGFGTCDFIVMSGKRLIIRDLKYGKGVPVSAVDNPQIRLYALGALQELGFIYDIEEVEVHIDQPRLNSYTTEILTVEELLEWGESIKGKAKDAWNDEGEFNPGDHCKFCKVRATCKARATHMLDIINSHIE